MNGKDELKSMLLLIRLIEMKQIDFIYSVFPEGIPSNLPNDNDELVEIAKRVLELFDMKKGLIELTSFGSEFKELVS